MIDRLSIREPPPGWPMMYQTWDKLLFLHWRVPVEELRPLVPERLTIDTFDGEAWVSATPFTMWGIRPILAPALPGLSTAHELNVRTYVHLEGVPGVWFFSLDANNSLAIEGARFLFHLPYFRARMQLLEDGDTIRFTSRRTHEGAVPAEFAATWTRGDPLAQAQPGTLEFFLIERYCLYSAGRKHLYRARVHHVPWPLRDAELVTHTSSMLQAAGIQESSESPLLHAQAEPLEVGIWPPERV